MALGHGAGRRGAGVRARCDARAAQVGGLPACGTERVSPDSRPADDERRRRAVDPALRIRLDAGAERAAPGRLLAAQVRREDARRLRRDARAEAPAGGHGHAPAVRHGLLDVLLAAEPPLEPALPGLRRPAPAEAVVRRPALRRRRDAVRRVPAPAAGDPARGGTPRRASLLAVQACPDDRLGRRADTALLARRRLAHPELDEAAARRHLSDRAQRGRRGGEPRVVPGTAARARCARSTHAGGSRDELEDARAARSSRRGSSPRPVRGFPRAEARAEADAHPCRLADRRLEAGACSHGGVPAARRRFHTRGAARAAPTGNSPGENERSRSTRRRSRNSFPASANSLSLRQLARRRRPRTRRRSRQCAKPCRPSCRASRSAHSSTRGERRKGP